MPSLLALDIMVHIVRKACKSKLWVAVQEGDLAAH